VGGPSDGLTLDTPARQRLATDLLAWGGARPEIDPELVTELREVLERGLAELGDGLSDAAARERRGFLLVTKTRLDRMVCDGLQLDAKPFEHTRASVRGILAHAVIERDWDLERASAPADVVAQVWHDEASRRPGDPRSLSAWMNAQPSDIAEDLRAELAELAEGFRDVWPLLPPTYVRRRAEQAHEVALADGRVRLFGRPDLVLDSRRRDGRARSLVIDLKTGRPRSEHDRHELRFYALLVTLATGFPPFRWATFYVTEGRHEAEDLRAETLLATARRVIDTAAQLVRLAAFGEDVPEEALRLRGGGWCFACQREDRCDVAAEARAQRAMSHPDAML
jgi:hypothetical protein